MPSETPRLPADTHAALLTRGAAYCPALAFEVRELAQPRNGRNPWTHTALSALAVALAVLTVVGWAVMLSGGGQ